jgi:hypothetical protein
MGGAVNHKINYEEQQFMCIYEERAMTMAECWSNLD